MIPLAILTFARNWWKAGVGALIAAAPAFLLGQCSGASHERVRQQAALEKANAAALRILAAANEIAAAQRVKDGERLKTQQKERVDAIKAAAPSRTGNATRALGCQRLRQAGRGADADAAGCGH
jgi:cysteine sulfinate desulfinase/cysteine desulfurase-like protein